MISLAQAKRSDRLMKATTSLTVVEFEALAQQFTPLWKGLQAEQTAEGTPRQRQPGGGRKSLLATAELKLFFILFYYKAYPTQDLMGLLFGFTQGQVSRLGAPAHRRGRPPAAAAQTSPPSAGRARPVGPRTRLAGSHHRRH